jgi:predicted nucleotidyltransferase
METQEKTSEKIMKILAKEPLSEHTATSLSKALGISRQGIWKTLIKLSRNNLISLHSVANTKKSTLNITLNFKNSITIRTLSLLIEKETLKYERWRDNFNKLKKHTFFAILFGSILHLPKEAKDIDLLVVVRTKKNFKAIENVITEVQQTQIKKIHVIDLTKEELKKELKNKNRAYLDAIKKGAILFGQENFIKFIEDISK